MMTNTIRLSDQQVADYHEDGYLIIRNVLSIDEIAEFRQYVQQQVETNAYPPSLKYPPSLPHGVISLHTVVTFTILGTVVTLLSITVTVGLEPTRPAQGRPIFQLDPVDGLCTP